MTHLKHQEIAIGTPERGLKVFRSSGVIETIACRAALGRRFLKEKLALWQGEVKVAPEISRIGSAKRAHRFRERPAAAVAEAEV